MEYKIIIRPEAEKDLTEAFVWYEMNRRGLGLDFLLQVDAGLRFAAREPEIHAPVYKGVRSHIIKRFPYKIIYLFENHKVIVLGVLHGRRSPNVLKRRIESI
ncbi:MAG: type II toxin-antitoxin system RelE/ParE family toxin [Deltaproteobacteria bacterium]